MHHREKNKLCAHEVYFKLLQNQNLHHDILQNYFVLLLLNIMFCIPELTLEVKHTVKIQNSVNKEGQSSF